MTENFDTKQNCPRDLCSIKNSRARNTIQVVAKLAGSWDLAFRFGDRKVHTHERHFHRIANLSNRTVQKSCSNIIEEILLSVAPKTHPCKLGVSKYIQIHSTCRDELFANQVRTFLDQTDLKKTRSILSNTRGI